MKGNTLEAIHRRLLLIVSLPPTILCLFIFWYFEVSIYISLLFLLVQILILLFCLYSSTQKLRNRFKILANIVEGISQGDYSIKISQETIDPTLNQLAQKLNSLSSDLSHQKLKNIETSSLLKKVITHIPVGVITIDTSNTIGMINPSALQIFSPNKPTTLNDLGLKLPQGAKVKDVVELKVAGKSQRFYLQIDPFINQGVHNKLLLLTDVDKVLRTEERKSWENLVRVVSHEINNSLSPVASISESLLSALKTPTPISGQNLIEPLELVHERALSLITFMGQIKHFSHLKPPELRPISVETIIKPAIALFSKSPYNASINVNGSIKGYILGDQNQLQMVLINLIKNAIEATSTSEHLSPPINIFAAEEEHMRIEIKDKGCGISNSQNLFLPFFTTKEKGSGIGLALSKQILEAHNGGLELKNNTTGGCTATLILPVP